MPTRFSLGLFLAIFGFIFSPKSISAAPVITITSIPDSLTVNEPFTLNANASGLASSSSYYTKIRIGTTSGSLTKGQTYNSASTAPDDWLSDSGVSWSKFPQITSDSTGNWNGLLTGRPADSAFAGANFIMLRIKKADSSSTTYDSATVAAQINAAAMPESPADPPTPEISFDFGKNYFLGEPFSFNVGLKNFDQNQNYYLKFRAGVDTNTLSKGQTQNGSAFYADNESWSKFPQITTDGSGNWSGNITVQITDDKPSGQYYARVRIRRIDSDTFYDSATKTASFSKLLTGVIDNVAAATSAPVPTASSTALPEVLILGTASALVATADETIPVTIPQNNRWPYVFVTMGGLTLLGSCIYAFRKRIISAYYERKQ